MIEWTTAASIGGRTALTAYSNRHLIQRYFKKALAAIDAGATNILVTGGANVGKSLLVAQMHGRARDLYYEEPTESTRVEVDAITLGEWAKLVRVLPGQSSTTRTLGENHAFDDNPKLEGVIHVVDFGFTAPRDPAIAAAMVRDGVDTVEKLRRHNLDVETHEIVPVLSAINRSFAKNGTPKWLIIAVNKVDLFYARRSDALGTYHPAGGGVFGSLLREHQKRLGSDKFGVYVLPVCANETDFTWNGHVETSSLPRQEQITMLRQFVETVAAISDKHS